MQIKIENVGSIDFEKSQGLVPAIVQDAQGGRVLMLGYMDKDAVQQSLKTGKVTFFSRSKNRLWTKGESSGNFLLLRSIQLDCDQDALLILADPTGPTCHTGSDTCFGNEFNAYSFLGQLERTIEDRHQNPSSSSYTTSLFQHGIDKIAQKVGEEAVEVIIAAKNEDRDLLLGELADLIYHLLVLLKAKNVTIADILDVLNSRHS